VRSHLVARPVVWRQLGFTSCPARSTIDVWKARYESELEQCIALLGDEYIRLARPDWTLVDSTPLADEHDREGRAGKTSRGWFRGYKLHTGCDELSVPLRATFTMGNVFDSTPAIKLLAPTPCVGGDAAYDNTKLKKKVRRQRSVPHFVHNPRRAGVDAKRPSHPALGKVRSAVERCFSIIKLQVLQGAWTRVKGYAAKAAMALASVLALQAIALYTLRTRGAVSLRVSEVRR